MMQLMWHHLGLGFWIFCGLNQAEISHMIIDNKIHPGNQARPVTGLKSRGDFLLTKNAIWTIILCLVK